MDEGYIPGLDLEMPDVLYLDISALAAACTVEQVQCTLGTVM